MGHNITTDGAGIPAPSSNNTQKRFFERFELYHYRDPKPVNRTEQYMLAFATELVKEKTTKTITEIYDILQAEYDRYTNSNRKHGTGGFTPFRESVTLAGHPEMVMREFEYIARGRKIRTFVIKETLFKNRDKCYEVMTDGYAYQKVKFED